jgi:hypothetical protein
VADAQQVLEKLKQSMAAIAEIQKAAKEMAAKIEKERQEEEARKAAGGG